MSNNINNLNLFDKVRFFLKICYYFSPSYYFYMKIKEEVNRDIELENIKQKMPEFMRYFFYCIDLIFISLILFKNTISIFKYESIYNKILYIGITSISIYFLMYCINKMHEIAINKNKVIDSADEKETNLFKIIIFSLKGKIILCIAIIIIALISLQNKCTETLVANISVFYFIMRPIHYYVVFYRDFKNKNHNSVVRTSDKKISYVELALFNYVKITLEFCILIYILKYMGWAFANIEINTYFELVYVLVTGNLKVTTGIEMFIDFLRIIILGMLITLNLATYMSLEVKSKNGDNNIKG